ncbi:uncharacterized protein ACA1_119250 [Acanthamoeba castellanii str. Neff]|uniref:Uncharacterized protein n=1 Tax=Acanthamoeba castellanii (strain ATCC 30010 / Neff) TaxID=1257118 RepID=L8HLX0_ACACF|nr:uncharacterized protein ACA1_119250 [Acanthamoeba castellanii str. Neff]ELR25648.1 hypothetical protein ACA1_119250 [Acanthamoeba castellanii str. Neff]
MADKKSFFEQKIKEATPKDPSKGEVKPVGQREWTPNNVGAHSSPNYAKQVGGGFRPNPPPPKNLSDLP